jgi:hypothetical protein
MCRIPINMCYNSKLFYISYFKFLYNYFLKFIVHKINSKLIKYEIVKLTERKKTNMTNINVIVSWML